MHRFLAATITLSIFGSSLLAQTILTVSPADNQLRTVDPISGTTLSNLPLTDPLGGTIAGGNGLALDPITGTIWAVLQVQGNGRQLATINPTTGTVALIGRFTDNFAGIAFDVFTQTLFGVTGDGGTTPETLYRINTTNATSTFVMALGNGTDGETITIPPFSPVMYHASGFSGTRNVDRIFESVDVNALTATPINYSGYDESEVLSMSHFAGGMLIAADLNDDLMLVQSNGFVTLLSTLDHDAKGIVFPIPGPATPYYEAYGDTCRDQSGFAPVLFGQNPPAPGGTASFVVENATGGAPAVLLIGTGTGAISLGACSVKILPLFPASLNVVIGGTGAGNGTGSVSLPIPSGLPPLDLYLQTALISGGSIVTSNPLHMHVN